MAGRVLVWVAAVLGACVFSGTAGAATISLGNDSNSNLVGCAAGFTYTNTQVGSGNPYVVPAGSWTVTSWSAEGSGLGGSVSLRLLRPTGGGSYLVVASSASHALAVGLNSFTASIPAQGGDFLALHMDLTSNCANFTSNGSDGLVAFNDPTVVGSTISPTASVNGYQVNLAATLVSASTASAPVWVAPPPTAAYCSVPGNTWQDGSTIAPGTFLYLLYAQPETDPHYKGAGPALFVQGKGITCDPPPAGYIMQGYAGDAQHVPDGLYPYYAPP